MTKKKAELADDTLVAAADIAIDGKHFDRGSPVDGVDEEQLRLARGARRVVTHAELMNRAGEPGSESSEQQAEDPSSPAGSEG